MKLRSVDAMICSNYQEIRHSAYTYMVPTMSYVFSLNTIWLADSLGIREFLVSLEEIWSSVFAACFGIGTTQKFWHQGCLFNNSVKFSNVTGKSIIGVLQFTFSKQANWRGELQL
ncbi:uncharacterized protein [Miscanthus floridulus]|uniref:uncharacterized protein isoform X2 n=1 Tax=Miscanthus floridulus TaxID=154761 RepID=UPI003458058F